MQKKQIKAKQPKTGRPERRIQPEKKPLVTQTINACPGQTGHPKSKIMTATHTGQAVAPSGTYPRARHTGTDTGLRGHTHAVRIEKARKQPDLVAAPANRYE